MTRNQKLAKLGNAIRQYRGLSARTNKDTIKWLRPPRPEKAKAVLDYLAILGRTEVLLDLADIQQFKSSTEMQAWMKKTFA